MNIIFYQNTFNPDTFSTGIACIWSFDFQEFPDYLRL